MARDSRREIPPPPVPEYRGWWVPGHPPTSRWSATAAGWSRSRTGYQREPDEDVDELDRGAETGKWTWPDAAAPSDYGSWKGALDRVSHRRWRDFSWIAAGPLLDSINDQIAKVIHDLVNDRRQRWIGAQRAAGRAGDDFVCRAPDANGNFLILGDPGEIDGSQYAVVEPLMAIDHEHDTDFMLVVSDVIYPAGDVNDYVNGFYVPYRRYRKPIYALPGNHDWYDGLVGFMFHFCGAEALPEQPFRGSSYSAPERVAQWLWRQSARPSRVRLLSHRYERLPDKLEPFEPMQPAPYFALDIGEDLRLVQVDTGILGTIDREQGEWLVRVSREQGRRAKILITGKPLWVDGEYHPCPIEWGTDHAYPRGYETVDDIVRDPANGYVASIGGDIHNYQRYAATVVNEREWQHGETTRPITYVVSGGAGAFMSATHRFGRIEEGDSPETPRARERRLRDQLAGQQPPRKYPRPESVTGMTEENFLCYPTRGDSLVYYARWFGRRAARAAVMSLALTLALLVALWLWDAIGERGDIAGRGVWNVFAAGVVGIAFAVLIGIALWQLSKRLPTGYKFAVTALLLPALMLLLVWICHLLVSWPGDDATWHWTWQAGLYTLAVVVFPLLLVLANYYGFSSSGKPIEEMYLPRVLALGVVLLLEVAQFTPGAFDDVPSLAVSIPIALAALGVFVLLVGRFRDRLRARGHAIARVAWLNGLVTLGACLLLVGIPIVHYWDHWQIRTIVVGAVASCAFLTLALWAFLAVTGGARVLPALLGGRLDPAEAHAYVKDLGHARAETAERRIAAGAGKTAERVARFLSHRWVRHGISEVGNADEPPMFKNFLHAQLLGDEATGRTLRLTSYGVTGWRPDEAPAARVPVEDRVDLDLGRAVADLRRLHAGE